jgi:PKD repeat protein
MQSARDTHSGLYLIIAVVFFFFLITPGVVSGATTDTNLSGANVTTTPATNGTVIIPALPVPPGLNATGNTSSIEPNVTVIPTTPVPPVFVYLENTTDAVNPPPLLIFDTPVIENLTCTLYGIAEPGSGDVMITSIFWDWGDAPTVEYHGFPNSHDYSSPGTYPLSITARQSDGQSIIEVTEVTVEEPVVTPTVPVTPTPTLPGGPGGPLVIHPPVLTLLEPAVDRMNVTMNGNLNAGSPGATIEYVSVDWNDGTTTTAADLPVTHQYSGAGIFTVSVTAIQSDGQSATRKIALEVKQEIPAPAGPTPSGPPQNDPALYLVITAMGIIGVVIVSAVLITRRGKDPLLAKGTSKAFPARTGTPLANRPSPEQLTTICAGTDVEPGVLDAVIQVAGEIAREGREGKAIGTAFVVGDINNVQNYSKQFVLNPFQGHRETERQITDAGIQGTIKEFAQLDGAFLITGSGVVEAAGRCITVDMSQVNLPGGMGSRHLSAAGITKVTASIGVVVSQSGGLISIFRGGKIVYVIRS